MSCTLESNMNIFRMIYEVGKIQVNHRNCSTLLLKTLKEQIVLHTNWVKPTSTLPETAVTLTHLREVEPFDWST